MVYKKKQPNPLYFTILGVIASIIFVHTLIIQEPKQITKIQKVQQPKPTVTLLERTLLKIEQKNTQPDRECRPHFMQLSNPLDTFNQWKRRQNPRKLIVLSPYNCEDEMLTIKIEIMGDWVDHFVIVESTVTNSHQKKKLCFNPDLIKDSQYAKQIIYTTSDYSVPNFHYWEQEVYVKNQLSKNLAELSLNDNDLIIMLDMDEVISSPNLYHLKNYDHPDGKTAFRISLRWSYYGFEWVNPDPTTINAIVSWREMNDKCHLRANDIRFNLCGITSPDQVGTLQMIGWHCSWCFENLNKFINKLESSSKLEDNLPAFKNLEYLADQRKRGLWFVDGKPNACFQKFNKF